MGDEHTAFKKLTDQFDQIAYSGDSIDVAGGFDPSTLLPGTLLLNSHEG